MDSAKRRGGILAPRHRARGHGKPPDDEGASMSRETGERYACEKCGAQLVYEKPCPCPPEKVHSEICCGEQMERVKDG